MAITSPAKAPAGEPPRENRNRTGRPVATNELAEAAIKLRESNPPTPLKEIAEIWNKQKQLEGNARENAGSVRAAIYRYRLRKNETH